MTENAEEFIQTVVILVSTWGLQVLGALAVLIVGRWVAGKLSRGTRRALERTSVDAALVPYLSGGVYYAVLTVVVIAVMGLFGIQTTSLIAVLGAASLAIGLAMQGTLSNFSAGVMLLMFRPFGLGNYVEVAGVAGSVKEIGIFATTLSTPDNVQSSFRTRRSTGASSRTTRPMKSGATTWSWESPTATTSPGRSRPFTRCWRASRACSRTPSPSSPSASWPIRRSTW